VLHSVAVLRSFPGTERLRLALLLGLAVASGTASAPPNDKKTTPPCSQCAVWNTPQEPFRVFGNTYYVGPHGLSSILIVSPSGHVLIDGALPESVPQIVANIKTLGFRIEDVKLILNSHVHFDHAGGLAELQRLSGARVVASSWSAEVLKKGGVAIDDPQYGELRPITRVAHVETLKDGESFRAGDVVVTAHLTPGHTPGGTSFAWQSCFEGRCLSMVYADSLSPISAKGFRFTDSPVYPGALKDFEKSFSFLSTVPCDILLTTHPENANLWEKLDGRRRGVTPDPMIDPGACRSLANGARSQLQRRLADEAK
jgi:metallo-beta-lactamase class B